MTPRMNMTFSISPKEIFGAAGTAGGPEQYGILRADDPRQPSTFFRSEFHPEELAASLRRNGLSANADAVAKKPSAG